MDYMNENNVVDQSHNGTGNNNNLGTNKLSQTDYENKKAAAHAEMARVNKLPSNSSYALHRIKVLNKILHLLSIPDYLARRGTGAALCRAFFVRMREDYSPAE